MPKQRPTRAASLPQNITEKREGATKGTEVYFYTDKQGRPCARGFKGRAQKPTIAHYYDTEEQREFYVQEWLDKIKKEADEKAARRAERNKPHTVKVDDILRCSWGHEQTNVDFYQVVKLPTKKSVQLRQLVTEIETTNPLDMCGLASTTKDNFKSEGEGFRAKIDGNNCVTISSYQFARPWDGQTTHVSWYG